MSKPAIVAVDDDPVVAAAITRDPRDRYSASTSTEWLGAMSVYFVHRYLATV